MISRTKQKRKIFFLWYNKHAKKIYFWNVQNAIKNLSLKKKKLMRKIIIIIIVVLNWERMRQDYVMNNKNGVVDREGYVVYKIGKDKVDLKKW